ncbi:MAG TPA: hypothetical protein VEP90_11720 [Methylomirabilota bacterium]|nr:hypothetical protein [Methylomirabilota bacterium]
MARKTVQQFLDLRQPDIDLEGFAEALVLHQIRLLIDSGGNTLGRYDLDDSLYPEHLKVFVERAVIKARQTHQFEQEWLRLKVRLSDVNAAWEQGRAAFQHDLTHASVNQEEMNYFSIIDFASESYAVAAAQSYFQFDRTLQKWLINGYMVYWQQHFLSDDDG